jgi:hypothetical protein
MSTGRTCGTPVEYCSGSSFPMSKGISDTIRKYHVDPVQAFKCYSRYLQKTLGYTMVDSRAFSPPDGGPVQVLTKKIRFGGELRGGKRGENSTQRSPTRLMPKYRSGGIVTG